LRLHPNDKLEVKEENGRLIFKNLSLADEGNSIEDNILTNKIIKNLLGNLEPMGYKKEQIKLAVSNECYDIDSVMDYIEKLPSVIKEDNNNDNDTGNVKYNDNDINLNIDTPLENDRFIKNDKSNIDNKEWLNNHKTWHLRWQQKYAIKKNSASKLNSSISHQLDRNNNKLFRSSSLIQWLNESHEKLNNHSDIDSNNNNYILSTFEVINEGILF
jgi:hypothetical protein